MMWRKPTSRRRGNKPSAATVRAPAGGVEIETDQPDVDSRAAGTGIIHHSSLSCTTTQPNKS
ncbi:predicted protein [Micromonas commoda]|uniref:Uncharacterized protein n=1 Tax=Micromonas commoda (strain RCC299 / NOUM17 / CCMP2709) TaxID=296587 RepID=C1EHN8_MICCC|nr:predicted protein [Micromonas commoda]ACO67538.1 predicted protein [Micromonas commoda]|eukprot:XP_002506280.1 predicted protein [Micromonas commoda]